MSAYVGLSTILHHALADYAAAHPLSGPQWRACRHIQQCRTAACGGTLWHCDTCGAPVEIYHACRDRHCPRCQHRATEEWCAAQREHLLPVRYHHLVFTLPHTLNAWVNQAPRVVYGALFEAAWQTLAAFGQDPRRLGGQLGAIAVLHTWTQTLKQHVHLHLLVPGGAVDAAGGWHPSHNDYLFPVRALARRFRGRMVSHLREAYRAGTLGEQDPGEVDARLDAVMAQDWVVYSKPVLTRPATIIDYLGRYTHRIALSDARIEGIAHGTVRLGYSDRAHGHRHRVLELSEAELIARMLKHVLPPGFQRVRHYGFLANACRARRLAQIRTALDASASASVPEHDADTERPEEALICPSCHHGHLHPSALIAPKRVVEFPAPTTPGEADRERRRPT